MSEHIGFLLSGLGSGGVFAALAMALVVTFRSSGVINFATGAIALYTAETYALLRDGDLFVPFPGLPARVSLGGEQGFVVATLISLAVAALLGVLLHYLVFRPLRNAPEVAKAVASIGVMLLLQALIGIRLGTSPISGAAILPNDNVEILGQTVRSDRLWFAVTIVVVALAVEALFRFTRFGLETRAAAESEKGALVTGLQPQRIAVLNWALSCVVAGIAGILISPIVVVIPVSYTLFIVPALAAALVGGFTRIIPAVAAGLVIGMVQSELVFLQVSYEWVPTSGMPELVPLLLVIATLVIRGRPLPGRGAVVSRTLGRAPRPRNVAPSAVVGAVAAIAGLLLTGGSYRSALIVSFIYAIICLSWVVVSGYAGQISLAQLPLAGVGAFCTHRFAETLGLPFPIAPLLAASAAGIVGMVFGLAALRIRGLPVAVVTLSLAVALDAFWFRNPDLNGGLRGASIAPVSLFGVEFSIGIQDSRIPFGLLCIAVLVAVAIWVAKIRTGRLGGAMLAVKANERSAAAAGVDVVRTKLVAFGIGSFIAGLGGSLLAYQQGAAISNSYGAVFGLGLFTTVYFSGVTSVAGGLNAGVIASGGIVFLLVDRNVEAGGWYTVVLALLLVLTVIRHPEGLVGVLQHVARRPRRHPSDAMLALPDLGATTQPSREEQTRSAGSVILEVDRLTVRYGGVTAVDQVSFSVEEGSIVGLIGPNGAGKTSLIDAITGYARCEGSIIFDGQVVHGTSPHRLARRGMTRTFQNVELYDDLTVEENIRVGQEACRYRPDHARVDEREGIDRILHLLDLGDVRTKTVKELPVGFRQLVSIGRALAAEPKVLLLDEPAGGLDGDESRWLGARLQRVRDTGVTILMIDHDMSFVLGICDRIQVLDVGELIASGTPAEIQVDPAVTQAYLGTTHAVGAHA